MRHVIGSGVEIRFDRETEVVSSMHGTRKPDKGWIHFDPLGHAHAWNGDELPTLYEKVTGTVWVGDEIDRDEVETTEYRCKTCDVVVEPKYVTDYSPIVISGPPAYSIVLRARMQDEEWRIPEDDVQPLLAILRRVFV